MFHSTTPSYFGRRQDVVPKVYALRASVGTLRGVSVLLRGEESQAYVSAGRALGDFSATLSTYFAAEENGGYFAGIVDDSPDFKNRISSLEETHGYLRDSIASARRIADRAEQSQMPALANHIDRILSDLERHEHAENQLLQDFFLNDQGSGE
jgi:hypothetical protein